MIIITTSATIGVYLSWDGGSSFTSAKYATFNTRYATMEEKLFGGPLDTWGRSWTVDEINDANFLALIEASGVSGLASNCGCDYMEVTVYYTTSVVKGEGAVQSETIVIIG